MRVLIDDSRLLIRATMIPWRIPFPERTRTTFGQVQQLVREGVEFNRKSQLLKLTDTLNEIRNGIAHRLTARGSFAGLRRMPVAPHRHTKKPTRFFSRRTTTFERRSAR